MVTTLTASRVVAGDPAVAVLLISGPGAADFLPDIALSQTSPGEVTGLVRFGEGDERTLRVVTGPPRRTPIAYISNFRLQIDGMPPTTGSLHVTSAGPGLSNVAFSVTSEADIPAEFEALFTVIADGLFDGLERAAREQHPAA
jgi:hypothetical protein